MDEISSEHHQKGLNMGPNFKNPVEEPISAIWKEFKTLKLEFPFIHILLSGMILVIVLMALAITYITLGTIAQIILILNYIIDICKTRLIETSAVQRSTYFVVIGIMTVFSLPFWVIQFPFILLGIAGANIIKNRRIWRIVLLVAIVIACIIFCIKSLGITSSQITAK